MYNEGSDSDVEITEPGLGSSEMSSESSLLMKSREQYQTHYRKFMEWKEANNKGPLNEDTFMDYFLELAEKMKPSTLWSQFSMLKYTTGINDNVDMNRFDKLRGFLRRNSVGYKGKTTNVFTGREIEKFLNDAPDSQFLAEKVSMIFGILGACRSHELVHITMKHIEDDGVMALVTIPATETDPERSFTICGEFYQIYKRYALLRPKVVDSKRFFLSYRNGRCVNQVIGLHKFGGMPKQIASYLNLSDIDGYTGHTFRRTSAALLANSGADYRALQQHIGGNSRIARDLLEEKKKNKIKISKQITDYVFSKPSTSSISENYQERIPQESTLLPDQADPLFIDCATTIKEEVQILEEPIESTQPTVLKSSEISSTEVNSHIHSQSYEESIPRATEKLIEKPIISSVATSHVPTQLYEQPKVVQTAEKLAQKPIIRIQQKNPIPTPATVLNAPPKRVVVKTMPRPTGQQGVRQPGDPNIPRSTNVPGQTASKVCLKWGSHHSNMQTSFPGFLNTEDFVDVTLACEGRSVKCHKVILSSCSDYLASLLRENPCSHPIILMKDLKFWEIEALVKFMYKGEVNIPHDKLPQLLKAAEALQVKGLSHFAPVEIQNIPVTIPQLVLTPLATKSSGDPRTILPKPTPSKPLLSKPNSSRPPEAKSIPPKSVSQPVHIRPKKRPLEPSRPAILPKKSQMAPSKSTTSKKPSLVSQYRREIVERPPPLRSINPEIKVESLDIPLAGEVLPVLRTEPTEEYEYIVTLQDTDDPEEADESENMGEVQEQMDLVLTDLFQDETQFLQGMDTESSRHSVNEARSNDALEAPPDDQQYEVSNDV